MSKNNSSSYSLLLLITIFLLSAHLDDAPAFPWPKRTVSTIRTVANAALFLLCHELRVRRTSGDTSMLNQTVTRTTTVFSVCPTTTPDFLARLPACRFRHLAWPRESTFADLVRQRPPAVRFATSAALVVGFKSSYFLPSSQILETGECKCDGRTLLLLLLTIYYLLVAVARRVTLAPMFEPSQRFFSCRMVLYCVPFAERQLGHRRATLSSAPLRFGILVRRIAQPANLFSLFTKTIALS